MKSPESPERLYNVMDAVPDDAVRIGEIQKACWFEIYPNEVHGITAEDLEFQNLGTPKRIDAWRRKIIAGGDYHVWVATEGDNVIGYVTATKAPENDLSAIYIDPAYQGRGIGSVLLDKACEWLGEDKDIAVSVVTYNQGAIRFYERCGFHLISEPQQDYLLNNGKKMPMVKLVKPGRAS